MIYGFVWSKKDILCTTISCGQGEIHQIMEVYIFIENKIFQKTGFDLWPLRRKTDAIECKSLEISNEINFIKLSKFHHAQKDKLNRMVRMI